MEFGAAVLLPDSAESVVVGVNDVCEKERDEHRRSNRGNFRTGTTLEEEIRTLDT
jgi:hypothetical protein